MEVREHEERSHSARYLILIFFVCVATCGVFFSLGFLVGYNERASRSVPSTEVVTSPPAGDRWREEVAGLGNVRAAPPRPSGAPP